MAEPTRPHPELIALRTQIDALDRELLALLNRRASLALDVGEVKKEVARSRSARSARPRSSMA